MDAMHTVAAGNSAAHAAAVERRMESIQSIFKKFDVDSRDHALMSAAEDHGPARWTAEEWAAIGRHGERQWLKNDLNGWAERVMDRAKALEAAGPANSDDTGVAAERSVGALGDDFKASVRRLRDIGLRILHIASCGDERKFSTAAELRQELDSTVVVSLGEFSSIVDRSLESMRSKRVEVPSAEVFRSSALQQKVISKLEMQLAEREALLVTVRRESDETYHALMRAEERTRQAMTAAVQKPSQRSRAVQCQLPAEGADVGVQVRLLGAPDNSDDEATDAASMPSAPSPKRGSLVGQGSSKFSSFVSTAAASPRSTTLGRSDSRVIRIQPHDALVLQKRLDQQSMMYVVLMALYKKSMERIKAAKLLPPPPPPRQQVTIATQTKRLVASSPSRDSSHSPHAPPAVLPITPHLDDSVATSMLMSDDGGGDELRVRQLMQMASPHSSVDNGSFINEALAVFAAAQEDQERDAVWSSIVGNAKATASAAHANPKPTDKRSARPSEGVGSGAARRTVGAKNTGLDHRSEDRDGDSTPVPSSRIPPIGNLVFSSPRADARNQHQQKKKVDLIPTSASSGSTAGATVSNNVQRRAPQLAPTDTATHGVVVEAPTPSTSPMFTQTDALWEASTSSPVPPPAAVKVAGSCSSQTSMLLLEDDWVQALLRSWGVGLAAQRAQEEATDGAAKRGEGEDLGMVVSVQPPPTVGVLRPPSATRREQMGGSGKPQSKRDHSPSKRQSPPPPLKDAVKKYQHEVSAVRSAQVPSSAAPMARRPLSASVGGPRAPQKFTLLSEHDIAHVLGMESRHESDLAQFSRWKDELQRLRVLDAEAVLVSPRTDLSSHHLPKTTSPVPQQLSEAALEAGTEPQQPRRRFVPPKTPRPSSGVGVVLPTSAVLTSSGAVEAREGSAHISTQATATISSHTDRPQPFHIPKIW